MRTRSRKNGDNAADVRIAELEVRLGEAEETLRAIRQGEVDALVISGANGEQVFTLQGAETPYRFLVEEMNEGALLLLPDGTVLYANGHFAELAGAPLEEIVSSSVERFFVPGDQPRVKALLGVLKKGGVREEFQLQKEGAGAIPVEVSLASLKREGVEGFSVVVKDLSQWKAAEEALRVSNAKLKEMVADLEQFSYSISHDMRAPLRAMRGFAGLLQESCETCRDVEKRDMLARIGTAARRLDELIQGSLEYARIVKQSLRMEPVELGPLMQGLLEMYPNLQGGNAEIRVEPNLPVVLGNEAALMQVFSNLLGNAVKFVAPGTRPRVEVRAEPRDGWVRIWVEDNGIGIAAEAQGRIFDMFQRANTEYEGTGIGLAVVRKVVERMGGKVGVESEQGRGSRFWVELSCAGGRNGR